MNFSTFDYEGLKPTVNKAINKAHIKGKELREDASQQAFLYFFESKSLQELYEVNNLPKLQILFTEYLVEWYKPEKAFRDKLMVQAPDANCTEVAANHKRRIESGETSIFIDGDEVYEQ